MRRNGVFLQPDDLTSFPGYELSRRAGVLGTPERPLSDLGLRSYVTFWISVLIRFFRLALPFTCTLGRSNHFLDAFSR